MDGGSNRNPRNILCWPSAGIRTPVWCRRKGIAAPTVTSQATVVAVEVRHAFETRGKLLLPAGSHVSINQATFRELSGQLATVDAVVSGPAPGHWQLVLVRESGQWLLVGTRRLS